MWQKDHPERTISDPQWDQAQINHYIIRSAEHFIEKTRKRSDIRGSGMGMDLFNYCDRNDLKDDYANKKENKKLYELVFLIQNRINDNLYRDINQIFDNFCFSYEDIININKSGENIIKFYNIKTSNNNFIKRNKETGELSSDKNGNEILAFSYSIFPNIIFISSFSSNEKLYCNGDPRICTTLTYIIEKCDNDTVSFYNYLTKQYMCAYPENAHGYISVDRAKVEAWEKYKLESKIVTDDQKKFAEKILYLIFSVYSHKKETEVESIYIDSLISFLTSVDDRKLYGINIKNNLFSFPYLPKQKKMSN